MTGGSGSRHQTWMVEVRANAHGQPNRDEEMTGQDNGARGNGYKHGDGEEDGGSNMGARRSSSKVSIYITIDYVHVFTDAS